MDYQEEYNTCRSEYKELQEQYNELKELQESNSNYVKVFGLPLIILALIGIVAIANYIKERLNNK